jgi:hypothetical protein
VLRGHFCKVSTCHTCPSALHSSRSFRLNL